jgi:lipopolysaccharide/colanic/teichoic acid biosynthesis glycosyltransferase
VTLQNSGNGSSLDSPPWMPVAVAKREVLQEDAFKRMVAVERKRTERSAKPFLLMRLDAGEYQSGEKNGKVLANVISALLPATRETDIIGWYKNQSSVGVMFTELVMFDQKSILSAMLTRIGGILRDSLTLEEFNQVSISFHFFPDKWDPDLPQRPSNPTLYPDMPGDETGTQFFVVTKRLMDILGSVLVLLVLAPVFLIVALAIKSSTPGPVLFKQRRVGRYGKTFTFLKFRSMYADNDSSIHREYVAQLIAGEAAPNLCKNNGDGIGVYKLTNDARITRVGAFLRRTSLDELPQLLNVLRGEMSLVGPRPAIPYEVAAYQTWHRRRVLEVKPGITGLWQVSGRCKVKFDEMVRLDIRYAKTWSPWLDMKILIRTPRAVLVGDGAH